MDMLSITYYLTLTAVLIMALVFVALWISPWLATFIVGAGFISAIFKSP